MQLRAAAGALFVLALVSCTTREDERHERPDPIYSPNGEPLTGGPLGYPGCEKAVNAWFARVNANHDGALQLPEFLADARRQFAAMDIDRNGVVTPGTLAQYRQPYLAPPGSDAERANARRTGASRRRELDKVNNDVPDPVMLADTKLRNKVTLDDFMAYARSNFALLDTGRQGRVLKPAVIRSSCG